MKSRTLFGINVRALRIAKGLSQEAFADACKLHRTYVGQVERGERNLSISTMQRIADGLGVDIPFLLAATKKQGGAS